MFTLLVIILVVAAASLLFNATYILHELGWFPYDRMRHRPTVFRHCNQTGDLPSSDEQRSNDSDFRLRGGSSDTVRREVHRNTDGQSASRSYAAGYRYQRFEHSALLTLKADQALRRTDRASNDHQSLIHFLDGRYRGPFEPVSSGTGEDNIASAMQHRAGDRVSVLLVTHPCPKPVAIRLSESVGAEAASAVDDTIEDLEELTRVGNIVFSWEMWPDFDPTRKFVRIDVPLRIKVRGWFNFDARVTYYLYVYIDNRSRLNGYVRWIETWVDGGTIGAGLNDRLNIRAVEASGRVVHLLNEVLGELNEREWSSCYLMPGSVPADISEEYCGHTDDDVSLILVPR